MGESKKNRDIFIGKNLLAVSGGQSLVLFLNIITVGIAGKYLGVAEFGDFNFYLVSIGIFATFFDFGLNPIIFRELSKKKIYNTLIYTVFIFRLSFILILLLGFNIYSYFVELPSSITIIINILLLNIIFSNKYQNFRELLSIPFKIELNMPKYMIIVVSENIFLLFLVFLIPIFNFGILYFVTVYTVANIPGFLVVLFIAFKKYKIINRVSVKEFKLLVKEALPLAGFVFFSFIYFQVDIILLKWLSDSNSIGLYSAAVRLSRPFMILPSAIVMTIFPLIVKKIKKNEIEEKQISFIVKILVLSGSLLSIVGFFKSSEICVLVFGNDYHLSGEVYSLLLISLIFMFLNFFFMDLLIAFEKQKYNFIYSIIVTFSVIILNLILIPNYSYIGSGISRLLTTFIGSVFLISILNKNNVKIKLIQMRTIAFLIVIFFLSLIISKLPLIFFLLVSIIMSFILLIILRVFPKYELQILLRIINREQWLDKLSGFIK